MKPPPSPPSLLSRREALARVAWLLGGTIVGAEFFLHGVRATAQPAGPEFTPADVALLDEIGDTIIPATRTPGAKAAQIGAFMAMMVNDCYDAAHQAAFRAGPGRIDAACRERFGRRFLEASPEQRTSLLNQIDAASGPGHPVEPPGAPVHYFRLLKQLTLLGYFTSEIGCTQALRYVETPGAFHGDVPYQPGDRAWFTHPDTRLL